MVWLRGCVGIAGGGGSMGNGETGWGEKEREKRERGDSNGMHYREFIGGGNGENESGRLVFMSCFR